MLQGLVEQLSRLELDEELGALGWRVLMSVDYEECWQQNGWVWIQPTDKGWIENIALFSGEPNGHCGFIKLLSVEELKELILKEAKGLMKFKPKDKPIWAPEWQKEVAKMVNDLLSQVELLASQLELEEAV
jgi:hypothetical protein